MRERSKWIISLIPRPDIGALSEKIPHGTLVAAVIVSSSVAGFGLGFLAANSAVHGNRGFTIGVLPLVAKEISSSSQASSMHTFTAGGQVVTSKNSTQYYFPWCGAVRRIKETNQIWFSNAQSAKRAGYTPATHCKGVQ